MAGRENRYRHIVIFCAALAGLAAGGQIPANQVSANPIPLNEEWPNYGNDVGGMRFSRIAQINRDNVSELKLAWVFHTEDISYGSGGRKRSGFETTPILVDGTLYLTTAFNRVIAIDPVAGERRWTYDPRIDQTLEYGDGLINRGVAAWLDPSRSNAQPCRRRIFESTLDARLIALDGATGKPCADFGKNGQVSLRNVPGYLPGRYHMTSPPAVIDNIVVVGSAIDDNQRVDMAAGVVRAFDARTGALRWSWDPIPRNTPATETAAPPKTWHTGAANAWSIMTTDPERDLVFVPTGSAEPRLLRRPAARRQQVGQLRGGPARQDRPTRVGIPARPSRSLGLRHSIAAAACHAELMPANRFRSSSRATRPAFFMCFTATPARPCFRWRNAPCLRATSPAK